MSENLKPLESLNITSKLIENRILQGEPFERVEFNFHVQKGLEALYYYNINQNKGFHELYKFVKLYFKYKSAESIWHGKVMTVGDVPTFITEIMNCAVEVDKIKDEYEISFGRPVGKVTNFMETYFRFIKQIKYGKREIDEQVTNAIYELDSLEKKLIDEDDWSKIDNPSDLLEYAANNNHPYFIDLVLKISEIFTGEPEVFDSSLYVIKKARMADWGYDLVLNDSSFSLPVGKVQRFVELSVPFDSKTNKTIDAYGNIIKY